MTDYSKMSDFEINRLVARAIDGLHGDDRTACDCYLAAGFGSAVKIPDGDIGWFIIDYCNNPADAWPIITENRIAIIPDSTAGEWVAFNEFTLYEGDWLFASDPASHVAKSNPLRAAMEVFLQMKESEKCSS